jgi:hypothetical protein
VKAAGEMIDIETSTSIVGFSFTKRSHYTWKNDEAAVRENVREIAQEIAKVIVESKK